MAEGYARTTGKVGVCIATSGPGATNFVTCLADAKMDSRPDHRHHRPGRHARHRHRRLPGNADRRGLPGDHQAPLPRARGPRTSPRVVKEAFHIATHRPARPGHHRRAARTCRSSKIVPDWDPPMNLPGYRPLRAGAARRSWSRSSRRSAASKKPIIYAGGGIIHAGAAAHLQAFAELTGIPVGLTLHGLGGFPADHYLCLHMLGMHGTVYSNYADQRRRPAAGARRALRRPRDRQADASSPSTARSSTSTSTRRRSTRTRSPTCPVHGDLQAALGRPERAAPRGRRTPT